MDWNNNPCIAVNIIELSYVHLSNFCQYIFIINIRIKTLVRRSFSRYVTEEWKGSRAKKLNTAYLEKITKHVWFLSFDVKRTFDHLPASEIAKRLNYIMQWIKCEDDSYIFSNDSPIIHQFMFHGCFTFMKYCMLLRTYLCAIIFQFRNQTKLYSNYVSVDPWGLKFSFLRFQ